MNEKKAGRIEHTVCGWDSVQALYKQRPHRIQRCYFSADWRKQVGPLCSYLAQEKKSYAEKNGDELNKIAGHDEHEGIIAFVPPIQPRKYLPKFLEEWQKENQSLLLINSCRNARHLGKIVHLAGFYGIKTLLIRRHLIELCHDNRAILEAAGAFETVKLFALDSFSPLIKPLGQHFTTLAIDCEGARQMQSFKNPVNVPGRPNALVLGLGASQEDAKLASHCEFKIKASSQKTTKLHSEFEIALILSWLNKTTGKTEKNGLGFREKMKRKKATQSAPNIAPTNNPQSSKR